MIRTNISQLKSRLSAFVAQARDGETVIILDRETPVAKLGPLDGREALVIREPKGPPLATLSVRRIVLRKDVDALELLRNDREAR